MILKIFFKLKQREGRERRTAEKKTRSRFLLSPSAGAQFLGTIIKNMLSDVVYLAIRISPLVDTGTKTPGQGYVGSSNQKCHNYTGIIDSL